MTLRRIPIWVWNIYSRKKKKWNFSKKKSNQTSKGKFSINGTIMKIKRKKNLTIFEKLVEIVISWTNKKRENILIFLVRQRKFAIVNQWIWRWSWMTKRWNRVKKESTKYNRINLSFVCHFNSTFFSSFEYLIFTVRRQWGMKIGVRWREKKVKKKN